MIEVWKDIKGFIGRYQVSNLGKVRSLNYLRTGKKRLLKIHKTKDGYLQVGLWDSKRQKMFYVHRLVCQAFLPKPNKLPEVNHLNEIKTDNRLENLEWISHKDNINYGTAKARRSKYISRQVFQFSKNGNLIKAFPSIEDAEISLDISSRSHMISLCCTGRAKTAYGYKWRFAEGVTMREAVVSSLPNENSLCL